jgi:glycerophosphoryl diester phosphodiesterase
VLATLRRAVWPLLIFQATVELVTLFLLDPLLALLLERIVSLSGDPFVANIALISFILSPTGLVAAATAAIGLILVNAISLGGISLVLWNVRQIRPVRQLAIWRLLLGRLPKLLAISAWAFVLSLLLAVPVLAVALAAKHWFLSAGDIYFYIRTHPPEFLWAVTTVGIVAVAGVFVGFYLLIRLGLAVPICLLRTVGTARALRLALLATRGRLRVLVPKCVAVAATLAVLWMAALAILSQLLGWLLERPITDPLLPWVGMGFAIITALALSSLTALSRAGLVMVLISDKAADEALPPIPQPDQAPIRLVRLRAAAVLLLCGAIPAAALIETARINHAISPEHEITITAHRAGSARAPENTMAALKAAIADGADAVEIDVQETADGKVVVLHDTDLRRVAGVARAIWDMRLAEVQALDVGSWFSPAFQGERVPTLRELAIAARGHVRLNVELKKNPREEDLVSRTVTVLREAGVDDQAAISSLDIGLLRRVRRIAPEIKLGLILATGIGDLRRVDVDFFALSRRLATPAVIRQLHATGREVHVWTLDDQASIAGAMLDGADDILTGDTRVAVQTRAWFDDLSEPERMLLRLSRAIGTKWMRQGNGSVDRSSPDDL